MNPDPLRVAADALRYWELRQQAAANNLANVETPGFKGERVFAQLLDAAAPVAAANTDLRAGTLRPTGNPLDVAIEDERQFFVIDTPAGERLVRGGALRLDENGGLVHASGNAILGEGNGRIVVPPGAAITIDAEGVVRADGVTLDRLRVDAVGGPANLTHETGGIFRPNGTRATVNGPDRAVRQGFIEESNVNTLTSMVDMIEIQRAYAAVQGSLRTIDGVLHTIVNDIGRVG